MRNYLKRLLITVLAVVILTAGFGMGTVQNSSAYSGEPKGYLVKEVSCTGDWQIYGWACDPDVYSRGATVKIYADNAIIGTLSNPTTSTYSYPGDTGVAAQCGGVPGHWFRLAVPATVRGRTVQISASTVDMAPNGFVTGNPDIPLLLSGTAASGSVAVNCPVSLPGAFTLNAPTNTCSGNNSMISLSYSASPNGPSPASNSGYFIIRDTVNVGNNVHALTWDDPIAKNPGQTYTYKIDATIVGVGTTSSNTVTVVAKDCAPKGTITAAPNPCQIPAGSDRCETTITWSTENAPAATVQVVDGFGAGQDALVGGAPSGTAKVNWITAANPTFTLFQGATKSTPALGSVKVTALPPAPDPATVTPVLVNAAISAANVKADTQTPYTISLEATDPQGGGDIGSQYGIINFSATPAEARGNVAFSNQDFPYWKSSIRGAEIDCTGGGKGAVINNYGPEYMNLISCSTSVSGNKRTTNFVVKFNTNFTSPAQNKISAWASDAAGHYANWAGFGSFTLEGAVNQCLQGPFGSVTIQEGAGCGTITTSMQSGATTGTFQYKAPNISQSEMICNIKVTSPNNGGCTLSLANMKGKTSNPVKPGETVTINFSNQCGQNISIPENNSQSSTENGCSIPLLVSPSDPVQTETGFTYKLADSESGLATATEKAYDGTQDSFLANYVLPDQTSGVKGIWVEFKKVETGEIVRDFITPELLPEDPELLGVSCSTSLANGKLVVDIHGSNFGAKGQYSGIRVDDSDININTWEKDYVKGISSSIIAKEGEQHKVELILGDGRKFPAMQCGIGMSIVSLGTKLFCQGDGNLSLQGTQVLLIDEDGNKIQEIVNIAHDGTISGLKTKLSEGKNYTISIKAPRMVRRNVTFTAVAGTSVVVKENGDQIVLPLGDIAPRPDGDGHINNLDRSLLVSQWRTSGSGSTAQSGDFNVDNRVNAFDWSCMRYNFGNQDDSIPDKAPRVATVSGTPILPIASSLPTSNTLASGLLSYWKFDETSGTTATDFVGGRTNGTATGTTIVAGKNSKGRSFSAVTDKISLGSSSLLNVTSALTAAAWINPTNLSSWKTIVEKRNSTNAGGWILDTGESQLTLWINTASNTWTPCSGGTVPLNTWSHVAGSYDGTNMKIYLNSNLVKTCPLTGAINVPTPLPGYIGFSEVADQAFKGAIDEVIVYNKALPASLITELYNGTQPQYSPD